ncbi:MAG: hypothetical protein CMC70_03515 [Flavobacteriaceae bacterium]|nr:hypothetical protein [Flavobacteriaceae bacterium]|tara:strand:+ start:434 stop:799 length:366 start_codon:yes stop_codon:yes gene_type:complete
MEKVYSLSSGELKCYGTYAIFDFTGHDYGVKEAEEFLAVLNTHYKNRTCVVISDRKLTKNINPEVYTAARSQAIMGIAIVSEDAGVREEAIIEQSLFDGAFSFFTTMEDAIGWSKTVVKDA